MSAPFSSTLCRRLCRRLAGTLAVALSLMAPVACTVTGGGVAYDGSVGLGLDYYEPFGDD